MMPNLRITSLLAEVDRWTGFSGAFTHLHSGASADDRRVVLTAVLADATNLGLTRMAEACAVASYRQLAWTAAWHLREETYRQALAILVNAQQRQPLAALFGAADVSSSDGQHFPTAGPGEAVGAVNAHYERTASALFYTHLSARQAPYHTVTIPPSGEAAYVIDGLPYHEADLSIGTHHTDGGAVSDHNFALAYLLGFYFAPRIPNLAERRLYTFGPTSAWPVLEPFIAGRIDERLISTHWNDVLRLATFREALDQRIDQLLPQPVRRCGIDHRSRPSLEQTDGDRMEVPQMPHHDRPRAPPTSGGDRERRSGHCTAILSQLRGRQPDRPPATRPIGSHVQALACPERHDLAWSDRDAAPALAREFHHRCRGSGARLSLSMRRAVELRSEQAIEHNRIVGAPRCRR